MIKNDEVSFHHVLFSHIKYDYPVNPCTQYNLCMIPGTQADQANQNHIKLLKLSDMHKTQNDENSDSDNDPDDLGTT